jgi:hypothetical protein
MVKREGVAAKIHERQMYSKIHKDTPYFAKLSAKFSFEIAQSSRLNRITWL